MSTTERELSLPLGGEDPSESPLSQDGSRSLDSVTSNELRANRTRNSMLWAAYGDALGFISEMADERLLGQRSHGATLNRLMPWTRRIGGRSGVEVELPAGCWSDDTQLRLAVSRSISDGGFDVETFASVELPVWPSYALGGGRASKTAAKNLANPRVPWYANTFKGWAEAGGNGAAMRIQPHVWASARLAERDYLMPVIEDSVCTHGHLRALVGACFYADLLAHCLTTGNTPSLDTAHDVAADLEGSAKMIEEHELLGVFWVSPWESASSQTLQEGWKATVRELLEAIGTARSATMRSNNFEDAYAETCRDLNLRDKAHVGSGVLTTVAAAALAAAADDAHSGCIAAANALGTDTDTIASMAGAMLGACDGSDEPPEPPLDSTLLVAEAERLSALAAGERRPGHTYPDLLRWTAPSTQADALVCDDRGLVVEGLGPASTTDDVVHWSPNRDFAWRWVRTCFDQSLLIKSRPAPPMQPVVNRIADRPQGAQVNKGAVGTRHGSQQSLPETPNSNDSSTSRSAPSRVEVPDSDRVMGTQPATRGGREDSGSSRRRTRPQQPPRQAAPTTAMTGEQLAKYAEHARRVIDDDRMLVDMLRQVARDGIPADLSYVATSLYDDLRS